MNEISHNEISQDVSTADQSTESDKPDRRKFLGHLTKGAILAAAAGAGLPLIDPKSIVLAQKSGRGDYFFYQQRALASYNFREKCAKDDFDAFPLSFTRPNNGDEALYPNRIGNYSKGLPHQSNGEVVPAAYDALLAALRTGNPAAFDQIPLGGRENLPIRSAATRST